MTDQEMAYEVGKRIVELHQENVALKAILMNMKDEEGFIPWRFLLAEDKKAPLSSQNAQNALAQLQRVTDNTGDCKTLLRTLHKSLQNFPLA